MNNLNKILLWHTHIDTIIYYLCIRFIFLSSQNVINVSHNMQVAASKTAPLINIIFSDKFLSLMEMVFTLYHYHKIWWSYPYVYPVFIPYLLLSATSRWEVAFLWDDSEAWFAINFSMSPYFSPKEDITVSCWISFLELSSK